MKKQDLIDKKNELDGFRPLDPGFVDSLDNWFRIELTYTSNAIEGNTLTRQETALVVEKGLTVGGKSLVEHLGATNHAKALDWVKSIARDRSARITERDVIEIHDLILKGIDDHNAGKYRSVPVRISGSRVILPNPLKVPALIRKRDRLRYISSLEKAQLGGSKTDYQEVIYEAINRSLDIYLKSIKGEEEERVELSGLEGEKMLMKVGELAKRSGLTHATIRYWTKLGLLSVQETTSSGYQLYGEGMLERIKEIQVLQNERYTLREILEKLTIK